jgi:hypothetical protein
MGSVRWGEVARSVDEVLGLEKGFRILGFLWGRREWGWGDKLSLISQSSVRQISSELQ